MFGANLTELVYYLNICFTWKLSLNPLRKWCVSKVTYLWWRNSFLTTRQTTCLFMMLLKHRILKIFLLLKLTLRHHFLYCYFKQYVLHQWHVCWVTDSVICILFLLFIIFVHFSIIFHCNINIWHCNCVSLYENNSSSIYRSCPITSATTLIYFFKKLLWVVFLFFRLLLDKNSKARAKIN